MRKSLMKTLSVIAAFAIVTNGFGALSHSFNNYSDSSVSANAMEMLRQPICTGLTDQTTIQIKCDEYNTLCYRIKDDGTAAVCGSIFITKDTGVYNIQSTIKDKSGKEYSVTSIEANAFQNQTCIKEINLFGIKTIGDNSFENCTNLEVIWDYNKVEKIGNYSFNNCSKLFEKNSLDLSKINNIGEGAFKNSGISSVKLSESLVTIKKEVFSECKNLDYIYIPDSVNEIGERAFQNDKNLETVLMPDNLKKLGEKAFMGCESMSFAVFKNPETKIGEKAVGWRTESSKIRGFVVWGNGNSNTAKTYADGFKYKDIKTASTNVVSNEGEFADDILKNVWGRKNGGYLWGRTYYKSSKLEKFYNTPADRFDENVGVCYGLAAISALSQNKYFDIYDYRFAFKFDMVKDIDMNNYITLNSIPNGGDLETTSSLTWLIYFVTTCWLSYNENLSDIVFNQSSKEFIKYSEYITYGADKAVLVLNGINSNSQKHHAVVCQGIEYQKDIDMKNEARNGNWLKYYSDYDARLLIYDVNNTNTEGEKAFQESNCIYINTKTGKICHPTYRDNFTIKMNFKPGTILGNSSLKSKSDVKNLFYEMVNIIYYLKKI